jgi:cleavage and polyadenylation specificity factor subunit 4
VFNIPVYLALVNRCLPSPKPNLPPPQAYDPPSPPSQRDLGPPPPGYGRYADFDRGFGGPGGGPGGPTQQGPRRNLDDVLCFKCGEKGHYANHCQSHINLVPSALPCLTVFISFIGNNKNRPGNRGGLERQRRYEND